jgi:hypothetical protein
MNHLSSQYFGGSFGGKPEVFGGTIRKVFCSSAENRYLMGIDFLTTVFEVRVRNYKQLR